MRAINGGKKQGGKEGRRTQEENGEEKREAGLGWKKREGNREAGPGRKIERSRIQKENREQEQGGKKGGKQGSSRACREKCGREAKQKPGSRAESEGKGKERIGFSDIESGKG